MPLAAAHGAMRCGDAGSALLSGRRTAMSQAAQVVRAAGQPGPRRAPGRPRRNPIRRDASIGPGSSPAPRRATGRRPSPRISLRAVRSSAERRHDHAAVRACATSSSTVKKPVGMLDLEPARAARGRDAGAPAPATEPGSTQAVATLTAPSTPIASCTRCGMKVRVSIAPPAVRRRNEAHLRHGLRASRRRGSCAARARAGSLDASASVPRSPRALRASRRRVRPKSAAAQDHDRHAVVDAGDVDAVDAVDDVARRQQRAAGRARRRRGTRSGSARRCPARRRCARRRRSRPRRPASATCATAMLAVLTMWMRTGVTAPATGTRPFSIAHGPTPASMLPQFWRVADLGLGRPHLQEQVVDVGVGARRRADDGDLAGERVGAAHAVDLARVRRAHRGEQHAIARRAIGGQVARVGSTGPSTCRRASACREWPRSTVSPPRSGCVRDRRGRGSASFSRMP